MTWRGTPCRNFNVGEHRRQCAVIPQTSDFFSSDNASANEQRNAIALAVLHNSLLWLYGTGGGIAILDATNTTALRRRMVLQAVADYARTRHVAPPHVIFLEIICHDTAVLRSNMIQKCTNSPDYRELPLEKALDDLQKRILEYERVYETVDEDLEDTESPLGPISYIKLINLREKVRGLSALQYSCFLSLLSLELSDALRPGLPYCRLSVVIYGDRYSMA